MSQYITMVCDRCSKEYSKVEPFKSKQVVGSVCDLVCNIVGTEKPELGYNKNINHSYDLCPECSGELIDWIAKWKDNELLFYSSDRRKRLCYNVEQG